MVRPNYRNFRRSPFVVTSDQHLEHSAKGSTWENHKYIKRIDGTYYYPDNYEGGRHLSDGESSDSDKETSDSNISKLELSETDIENLAKEVIRGNFGNGEERKDLLSENYAEIQKRVNELMKGSIGSKKVSEASEESVKKAEEAAKKASTSTSDSKVHSGVNMDEVLRVYRRK